MLSCQNEMVNYQQLPMVVAKVHPNLNPLKTPILKPHRLWDGSGQTHSAGDRWQALAAPWQRE